MIDSADILDGIERLAALTPMFGAEKGKIIGLGLELVADVVRAVGDEGDPVGMIQALRQQLRSRVTADIQEALDKGG